MNRTIQDVTVGETINHHKNGRGMITNKTQRTIEVTYENGYKVKLTYRYKDAYSYASDFS